MAPKTTRSTRKRNQSWALVVSTPEASKGQKRKASVDTTKEKSKKQRGETSTAGSAPLDRDPMYFLQDRDWERYNIDFSLRKVINGRWIDYDFFDAHNFSFSSQMDDLGWMHMSLIRDDVYPDLVAYFYANATRGLHSDEIKSYVKGKHITLDKSTIRKIVGIKTEGEIGRQSVTRKDQMQAVYGSDVNLAAQPTANTLPLELRLVHHFICTILIPKTGKFEYVSDRELFFLWAYVTGSKIDLALFILDQMFKATIKKVSLPYGMLLTRIFKYARVDLDDETIRVPKPVSDEYNEKTLKRMGYELIGNKWMPKTTKKIETGSSSKGKEKVVGEDTGEEGSFENDMRAFMLQMTESLTLLHKKVDNMAFRLVVCERKIRNLSNIVGKGKQPISESSDDEENKNDEEGKKNEEQEKEEDKKESSNPDESSETDSDAAPLIRRTTQRRYSTRRWEMRSKFKNTRDTALELSPSPSPSPAPSTPIHNASSTSPSP